MSETNNHVSINSVDTQNGEPMSQIEISRLGELEAIVETGLQTFYVVGSALIEIRDSRLYRQGYQNWEDYCRTRWGFTDRRARQLIEAASTMNNLQESEEPLPILPQSSIQAEELAKLETPELQREAWKKAIDTAPLKNGIPQLSGSHVQRIVDDMRGIDRTPEKPNTHTSHERDNGATDHYHYDRDGKLESRYTTLETPESDNDFNSSSDDSESTPAPQYDFNYKRDMRSNQKADEKVSKPFDFCQTPSYALTPLLPYLNPEWTIWESAVGEGNIAMTLGDNGFETTISDILRGQNFFEYEPDTWDAMVTNPPYSLKYRWLKRCYELGKPFALLIPVETLGAKAAQELMQQYGFEVMLLNRRVSFKMPNKGWDGAGAQFSTMWFCWQMLPQPVMFGEINYPSATDVVEDDEIY